MATEEGEEKDSDWSLTGFLFGNINEKGELEDESILDEVTEHFYMSILANFLTKYFCLYSNIFGYTRRETYRQTETVLCSTGFIQQHVFLLQTGISPSFVSFGKSWWIRKLGEGYFKSRRKI